MTMNDCVIVIPSRERAHWLMHRTNHTLKYVAHLKPCLFVRDDDSQLDDYIEYASKYDVELKLQPSVNCVGVARAYDMLIDEAILNDYKRLIILDDDLVFREWDPTTEGMFSTKYTPREDLSQLIAHFAELPNKYMPAMSLLPITSRTKPSLISFAAPLMWAYSFYLPHFAEHPEHRFWQGAHIEARCDLNLSLMLLTEGYLTSHLCSLMIFTEVNYPGGCSTYRDLVCESASVDYLVKMYPEYIKTRPKRGWVGDDHVIRQAPIVQWKKAFSYDRFKINFDRDAGCFVSETRRNYERVYEDFVKRARHEVK